MLCCGKCLYGKGIDPLKEVCFPNSLLFSAAATLCEPHSTESLINISFHPSILPSCCSPVALNKSPPFHSSFLHRSSSISPISCPPVSLLQLSHFSSDACIHHSHRQPSPNLDILLPHSLATTRLLLPRSTRPNNRLRSRETTHRPCRLLDYTRNPRCPCWCCPCRFPSLISRPRPRLFPRRPQSWG